MLSHWASTQDSRASRKGSNIGKGHSDRIAIDSGIGSACDRDMQWLIALVAFVAFLFALPRILATVKRAAKGGAGAATLVLGLAFSSFFDPAKQVATENIEKQKEMREDAGHGELNDPSS